MGSNSSEQELITKDFLETQKKFEQANERRRILVAQESENQMVNKELEQLESDAVIYKLIGSVMVKQSLDDARGTVSKRLEYISGEIESVNKTLESLQSKIVETSNQVSYICFLSFPCNLFSLHYFVISTFKSYSCKNCKRPSPPSYLIH